MSLHTPLEKYITEPADGAGEEEIMLIFVNEGYCGQAEDMRSALKAVQPYLSMKESKLTFPDGSNVYKITIRQESGALVWEMGVKEINLLATFIKVYKTPTAVLFDQFGCPDIIHGDLDHLFREYADVIGTNHSFYGTERRVAGAYVIDPDSENVFSLD